MFLIFFNLIYSIPSLIIYFLTAYVIIKHWSSLKSSFFQWYLFDFAMNIATMFFTFITLKISAATCQECLLAPMYHSLQDTVFSNFLYAMMFHMSFVQYCTTATISVNRFSILLDSFKFEPLWRKWSWIPMISICVLPFISTYPIFGSECNWKSRIDDTFVLTCDVSSSRMYNPLIVFQGLCIFCSIFCNAASCFIVLKATKELKKKMEVHFTVLISITTMVQFAGTVITAVLLGNSNTPTYTFVHTYILPFISDGFTIMHPWLLICLSTQVRNHIKRSVMFFKKTSVVDVRQSMNLRGSSANVFNHVNNNNSNNNINHAVSNF